MLTLPVTRRLLLTALNLLACPRCQRHLSVFYHGILLNGIVLDSELKAEIVKTVLLPFKKAERRERRNSN